MAGGGSVALAVFEELVRRWEAELPASLLVALHAAIAADDESLLGDGGAPAAAVALVGALRAARRRCVRTFAEAGRCVDADGCFEETREISRCV